MSGSNIPDSDHRETVLEWTFPPHTAHRIQVAPKPGSAHWSVTKDTNYNGDGWERVWGTEAIQKPDYQSLDTGDSKSNG